MINPFLKQISQRCEQFSPYFDQVLNIPSHYFSQQTQTVAQFITEIQQSAERLAGVQDEDYINAIASRVFHQFELLHRALNSFQQAEKTKMPEYRSTYRFHRAPHRLPPEERLAEYRKALRALNEKISWLAEQSYRYPQFQSTFKQQIQETEYRKQKCLDAIDELESQLTFKK